MFEKRWKYRRVLALLLVFAMMFSLCPAGVAANEIENDLAADVLYIVEISTDELETVECNYIGYDSFHNYEVLHNGKGSITSWMLAGTAVDLLGTQIKYSVNGGFDDVFINGTALDCDLSNGDTVEFSVYDANGDMISSITLLYLCSEEEDDAGSEKGDDGVGLPISNSPEITPPPTIAPPAIETPSPKNNIEKPMGENVPPYSANYGTNMGFSDFSLSAMSTLAGYVRNGYLEVYVGRNGNYTIGTTGGNPNNPYDSYKKLTYGHPGGTTSETLVRVNGRDYLFERYVVDSEVVINSHAYTTAIIDGIKVIQSVRLTSINANGLNDTVEIGYEVINNGPNSAEVGIRVMIDTMLADNDGSPFVVGDKEITRETEYVGSAVPNVWLGYNSLITQDVESIGYFYADSMPDKVQFAAWSGLVGSSWNYVINPNYIFADSAIAAYFTKTIPAGGSEYVHMGYGINAQPNESTDPPMAVSLAAPAIISPTDEGTYDSFSMKTYIENVGTDNITDVWATFDFQDNAVGVELVDGTALTSLDILVNETAEIEWEGVVKAVNSYEVMEVGYLLKVGGTHEGIEHVRRVEGVLRVEPIPRPSISPEPEATEEPVWEEPIWEEPETPPPSLPTIAPATTPPPPLPTPTIAPPTLSPLPTIAPTPEFIPDEENGNYINYSLLKKVADEESAIEAVVYATENWEDDQKSDPDYLDSLATFVERVIGRLNSLETPSNDMIISYGTFESLYERNEYLKDLLLNQLDELGIGLNRDIRTEFDLRSTRGNKLTVMFDPSVGNIPADIVSVNGPRGGLSVNTVSLPDMVSGNPLIVSLEVFDNELARLGGGGSYLTAASIGLMFEVNINKEIPDSITFNVPVTGDGSDYDYVAVIGDDGTVYGGKYDAAEGKFKVKLNKGGLYMIRENKVDFADIQNKSADMQESIRVLASKGVLSGRSETEFAPDDMITRAEIATEIVKVLYQYDISAGSAPPFSDVTMSDWYYETVSAAKKHGIIYGYEDNTFKGDRIISKDQLITMVVNTLITQMGYFILPEPDKYLHYSDVNDIPDWARLYVAFATKEDLLVQRADGMFVPNEGMTRGEAAIIIKRLFDRIL